MLRGWPPFDAKTEGFETLDRRQLNRKQIKASKAAPRVAVYIHKDPAQFLSRLGGERIQMPWAAS